MENNNNPPCIGCKSSDHMVLETETVSMKHYYCEYCTTRTQQVTTFGKVRPFLGIATILLFGIKLS